MLLLSGLRLTGDARPRFFESYALLEEQVRGAREAMTVGCKPTTFREWVIG